MAEVEQEGGPVFFALMIILSCFILLCLIRSAKNPIHSIHLFISKLVLQLWDCFAIC